MVRRTNPREGGMETPPDADAIARAFMVEVLAKDQPSPVAEAVIPEVAAPEQPVTAASKSRASGDLSQTEVDAYIASLDAQVTDGNLLTPFTGMNKRRAEELSQPFSLPVRGDQPVSTTPATPVAKQTAEPQPQTSPDLSLVDDEPFKFIFPRLGQDKSVRYRSSDGSIYEITKKPGGYRITKDGNPVIASISRTEIMKRGQAEGWVAVGSAALTGQAGPTPEGGPRLDTYEIKSGDVWVRGEEGHGSWGIIRIQSVVGTHVSVNSSEGNIQGGKSGYGGNIEIDDLRKKLHDEGYVLRPADSRLGGSVQPTPTAEAAAAKSPEQRAELGLMIGEVWSAQEGGHDVEIEILEFFDGPAKAGNARMVRIRRVVAGPVTNENKRMEIPLYKLAEQLKSYTKKREAPKPAERIEPPLDAPTPPLEVVAAAAASGSVAQVETPETGASTESVASTRPAVEGRANEAATTGESGGASTPDTASPLAEIDRQIAKLKEEVASERAAFIAVEESQRSAWKNLTRIFRGLSHKDSDDTEVAKYRAFYDEKIVALQNAELEKLKRSGKTVKELRPEMAALIREFEFDEAERIYDARQEMRLAKTNQPLLQKMKLLWADAKGGISGPTDAVEVKAWIKLFAGATGAVGSSAIQGIEKGGAAYNKLMRSKAGKLILAASLVGAGAGIAAGGLGVAAGAFALKRLAAGAGVAVSLEDVSERIARARREKRRSNVEQDHEMRFDAMESEEDLEIKLGNKQEIDFSKLEKYLKEVSAKTRRGEGARRRNELLRKSGAIFVGAVLGSGAAAHFANEYIGGASRAHAATGAGLETDAPTGGPGAGPSVAESPAVAESLKDTRAIPVPVGGEVSEALKDTRAIPVPGALLEGNAKEFLESHEVKRGESIWKLASKAVADTPGMDERASGRFSKLVEIRLAEKLEASPELARSAGFVADADGKFSPHQIQAGAKLELGKLLSQDELLKLIEEAKTDVPIGDAPVSIPDTPVRETVTPITTPALSEAEMVAREEARIAERIPPVSPDERAAILATFPESPTTELIKPDGNVMKYIESLSKDDQEKLFRNFKKISVELLQTNDVMGGETYDMRYDPAVHPELAKANLSTVIADHKHLAKNPLMSYDRLKNPLHWSQMEEVAKFAKASAKAFGASVAEPKVAESVQEYTLRMIAIARNQGVKIPGFRMLD